jgi:phenylacetate-CoA ligase
MINIRKPIIYTLIYLSGNKILTHLNTIQKLDRTPPENLKQYQRTKLKKLLQHAYDNVPYYKPALEASGVCYRGKINIEKVSDIPVLTKDIIRENFNTLKSRDLSKRNWYFNTSGGSTGEPVTFIQDSDYNAWNIANKLYYKTIAKQKIGDRELRLWGSTQDILAGKKKLSARLKNRLYNRKDLNAYHLSSRDMFEFVKNWNAFKPEWVEAYSRAAFHFAEFIKQNRLQVHTPKGILCTAGSLYEGMQSLIGEVFRCPVFNRYGSREVGDVACSCAGGRGLHLSPWNHYVEILDDRLAPVDPGSMGNLYITVLNNYSMPLIRYKIGDIGEKAENETVCCNRAAPVLKNILGRETDLFKLKDGGHVYGGYFTKLFYHKKWIKKFQILQKDYDLIDIRVVKDNSVNRTDMFEVEKSIKALMGQDCRTNWIFQDEIKTSASGKYFYVKSEINNRDINPSIETKHQ